MIKKLEASNKLAKAVEEAADVVSRRVLRRFSDTGTKGREEMISAQLVGELTDHFIRDVADRVSEIRSTKIVFDAIGYKKTEENKIGADFAGAITYECGGKTWTKVFLVQAKVATRAAKLADSAIKLRAGDPLLLGQCKRMLHITPASFVMVYSQFGVHVVPAVSVAGPEKNYVDTEEDYYREFGGFYGEVFKSFIGDMKLGNKYRKAKDLEAFCDATHSNRALMITAKAK